MGFTATTQLTPLNEQHATNNNKKSSIYWTEFNNDIICQNILMAFCYYFMFWRIAANLYNLIRTFSYSLLMANWWLLFFIKLYKFILNRQSKKKFYFLMRPCCYSFIKCSLCYLRGKTSGGWLVGEFDDDGPKQKEHSVQISCWDERPTVLMKTTCRQGNWWRFFRSAVHFSCLGVIGRTQ